MSDVPPPREPRLLVFALCDRCARAHDVVLSPTDAGIEVRARRRGPLIVGGGV
jgi:hypothetical protein